MDLSAPIYSKPSPLGEVFHLIFAELHNKTIGKKKKKPKKLKLYIKKKKIKTPTSAHKYAQRYFNYASLLKSAEEKKSNPTIFYLLFLCACLRPK